MWNFAVHSITDSALFQFCYLFDLTLLFHINRNVLSQGWVPIYYHGPHKLWITTGEL